MSYSAFAALACSVEIYPFEGNPYSITGGQIIAVSTGKTLYGGSSGTFTIELAPGGPMGPEDPNTWSQVITPMSGVLIGMDRGGNANIVMIGVVTTVAEGQEWHSDQNGSTVTRTQIISGADFTWFFNSFNYFALTFYGLVMGTSLGGALDYVPQNLTNVLSQGLVGGQNAQTGNPVQVGRTWFQKVMFGQSGLMAKTFFPFINGSQIPINGCLTALWENYPNIFIPMGDFFMTGEESWMQKFLGIFPFPWYEFFVTTAPIGTYGLFSEGITDQGGSFTMQSMPYAPAASPLLVARINPVPSFGISGTTIGQVDTSRWNALPLFDFTQMPFGFARSDMQFSNNEARNFYQLNPIYYRPQWGQSNQSNIPAPFFFLVAADPASVQRYGFRPQVGTTRWFFDPTGTAAQNQNVNFQDTMLELTGKLISWHHPLPLMMRAQVTIPLTPPILIGTRFRYAPFKDGEPWDFYVEGVQHRFTFGGGSMTTLTLSRGLPSTIYGGAGGLLQAIYTGNAMRNAGTYQVGLPPNTGPTLQVVETPQQAAELNQRLTNVFVTPQGQ